MLEKLIKLTFLLFLLASPLLGSTASAQSGVNNFTIPAFTADYYLDRDSNKTATLHVKEIIVAEFPAFNQNHGILRAIPESYKDHTLNLEIQSVKNEMGVPWKYTTSSSADNKVLKIGDANRYVYGRQTYVIEYDMHNVVAFEDDHEEFYWDINGDQWKQPFGTVTARIHIAENISSQLQDRLACFQGRFGRSAGGCTISKNPSETGQIITVEGTDLASSETLTAVIAFDKGTFVLGPEIAAARRNQIIIVAVIIGANLLIVALSASILYKKWRKVGRDAPGKGTIIPEYSPPKGLNPLIGDTVLQEKFRNQAISATIIDLAVRKCISIYEIDKKGFLSRGKDYMLEFLQAPPDLTNEEWQVLIMFFKTGAKPGAQVTLSTLKNDLYTQVKALKTAVEKAATTQGYFVTQPSKIVGKYTGAGIAMLIGGAVLCFTGLGLIIGPGLVMGGLLFAVFAKTMAARTQLGVTTRDHLRGLEMYMKLAEADRIRYLQSPEGAEKTKGVDLNSNAEKVKLFEKLLPYAMLFGIEKEWAEQFKDLYTQPPDWFHGNMNTFNTVYLASALGNFGSVATTAFTPPSSSGSSGFGGGGFSGGGGGGGGGGGW